MAMASCSKRKSESDSRDIISQLPLDVKERILGLLPTRDAARTVVLSTQWRDVWWGIGRIVVDSDLIRVVKKYKSDKRAAIAIVNLINDIFLCHGGPVKQFTLDIRKATLLPQQSDLDKWFLFLSRNSVEELNIYIPSVDSKYKLPSCILSCRTIKELLLCYFIFDCPMYDRCIFPGVTTLIFQHVDFNDNVNGIVSSIPNLEDLVFASCGGISNFVICAPKLERLAIVGDDSVAIESRWLTLHLKTLKTLCVEASKLPCENGEVAALMSPIAIDLQVIKLFKLDFSSVEQLIGVMQLLKKSPNLRELEIFASDVSDRTYADIEAISRLLEDPDSCIITQDLEMLDTVKMARFSGSVIEMLFVKMLFSKSPALERFFIQEDEYISSSIVEEIPKRLLRFKRASSEAQIVYMDYDSSNELVDYPGY